MFMSRLRIYFVCDNVAYWTKRNGFDPRTATYSPTYDASSPVRTFSGGVNISF